MISKIDHIVITTSIPHSCVEFYGKLGFASREYQGRFELFSGDFKINVHILGKELSPHAQNVCPGSADLCFETTENLQDVKDDLESKGIAIELGIIQRYGVRGKMQSIYVRDPDGNLVEISSYD